MNFLTNLKVTTGYYTVSDSARKESGQRDTRVIKNRVLIKIFRKQFYFLSDAKENKPGSLNKWGMTGLLMLRTFLAILQKLQESSLWEVIYSIVLLA